MARLEILDHIQQYVDPFRIITGKGFRLKKFDPGAPLLCSSARRRSLINEAAQTADDAPDFSERIRADLPTGHR
jgi:hypothetical protein